MINDRFQLTNYGSEVQKAIDDVLITIPQELALKAYKDEVLTKNQTTPYTPLNDYNPCTKLYADKINNSVNSKIDDEVIRAKNAENVLNNKKVLTYHNSSSKYEYITLLSLDNNTQSLIDENALDAKLAELSVSFFIAYTVDISSGDLIESKFDGGVYPYSIMDTLEELPTNNVPDNAIGLVLNNNSTIKVYKYNSTWNLLNTPTIESGWLFASTSTGNGFYWFANTWNQIDTEIDLTQYYTKSETNGLLNNYININKFGDLSNLTTTFKENIVGAVNEVDILTKTKDSLPIISSFSVMANLQDIASKPNDILRIDENPTNYQSLSLRTSTGQLRGNTAILDNDLTPLLQVKNLINNIDFSSYQLKIPAGVSNDIVAYSGVLGKVNSLTRNEIIDSSASHSGIPTSSATKNYVDNSAPLRVTQGDNNTSVTTNQITFWIEN